MKVIPFLFTAALLFSPPLLFSQVFFYVSDGSNPFINKRQYVSPNNLSLVNASSYKGINKVSWTAVDEKKGKSFQVYKSTDNISWKKAGSSITAVNTDKPDNYSWNDSFTTAGISYYRILQLDYDDNYSYSIIVTTNSSDNFDILIYPNPASTALSVDINKSNLHFKQISIYTAGGRLVSQEAWGDTSRYLINIIDLVSGAYQLVAQLSDGTIAIRSFFKR